MAYFDAMLGLDYFRPPLTVPPTSTVAVSSASSQDVGFSCQATFVARPAAGANASIRKYLWLDSVGRPQSASGPRDDTMTMSASTIVTAASFTFELVAEGVDGLDRYTTYTSNFGDGCVPPG